MEMNETEREIWPVIVAGACILGSLSLKLWINPSDLAWGLNAVMTSHQPPPVTASAASDAGAALDPTPFGAAALDAGVGIHPVKPSVTPVKIDNASNPKRYLKR